MVQGIQRAIKRKTLLHEQGTQLKAMRMCSQTASQVLYPLGNDTSNVVHLYLIVNSITNYRS